MELNVITAIVALTVPFLGGMIGVMYNNARLSDIKEVLRAEIKAAQAENNAALTRLEAKVERNHSEILSKIADLERALERAR